MNNSIKHAWEEKCVVLSFLEWHIHFQQETLNSMNTYIIHLLQGASSSFLVLDSNVLERVWEYSTADHSINLGHLAFSPTGTTESLWASPTVSTPYMSRKSYKLCVLLGDFDLFISYSVWDRVRSLLPCLRMCRSVVCVIFLHCIILNSVIFWCLVLFFLCLHYWFAEVPTATSLNQKLYK